MRDLVIIGAGPAGMSAAITATELGLDVVVLDEQDRPGGQIYRNVEDDAHDDILGAEYVEGRDLVLRFNECGVDYRPKSRVWRVDEDGVCFTGPDGAGQLTARHVLLAVGAMERPVPTPGWTLPGVMTAGAAQIMLKSSGLAASNAVFVGSGPLLFLIVAQYLRAGVAVKAVLETTPRGQYFSSVRHLPGAIRGWPYLRKGIGLVRAIRRAGVPVHRIDSYAFHGDDRVKTVAAVAGEARFRIETDSAFVHQGVIPAAQASLSSGCAHDWDEAQLAWRPRIDAAGRTDKPWLRIAGDCGGIAGAVSARYAGTIATIGIAADQGLLSVADAEEKARHPRALLQKDKAVRPFLDSLFRPRLTLTAPQDDETLVCRCELVSRGDIRAAVSEGCPGPNQLKAFTRAGMGPCQGRMCGPTVTATMAELTCRPPESVGHYKIRSPFRPVTVSEIASIVRGGD